MNDDIFLKHVCHRGVLDYPLFYYLKAWSHSFTIFIVDIEVSSSLLCYIKVVIHLVAHCTIRQIVEVV